MSQQSINTAAAQPATPARARATFAAASFGNLRAASGEGRGQTLRLLLADIDEDPHQPRTVFDADALQSMAESVKAHGVVQPIVVQPAVNGRYLLVFGARRLRASRLAGVADIPAVVRPQGAGDFAAQLIENQQRAHLSNSDLAAAIARLVREGSTNKQIAAICSLKDYQVAAFRQVGNFPPELAARLDTADIRALYDLFRQWGKTPVQVIAGLPEPETFISVTEARRIIGAITGKPTGSFVIDRPAADAGSIPPPPPPPPPPVGDPVTPAPVQDPPADPAAPPVQEPPPEALLAAPAFDLTPPAFHRSQAAPGAAGEVHRAHGAHRVHPIEAPRTGEPVFIVDLGEGRTGRLVVHRRAAREGWALVACATEMEEAVVEVEVEVTRLRIVRIA
jgi:ParB family chromosome partitioning protein